MENKNLYKIATLKKDKFAYAVNGGVDNFSKLREIFQNYELVLNLFGEVFTDITIGEESAWENLKFALDDAENEKLWN